LGAFVTQYLAFSEKTHARDTFTINSRVAKLFQAFLGDVGLDTIKPLDIERFKNSRLESLHRYSKTEKIHPASVNMELRAVRAMFGFAVKWEILERTPFRGVTFAKIPQRPPAFLNEEQIKKLFEKVDREDLKAIIIFALNTGMRRGEIMNLRWKDVDFANRVITVSCHDTFRTKTGRTLVVPMNGTVFELLNSLPRPSEYVFVDSLGRRIPEHFVTVQFKQYIRDAELPEALHFHSTRHSFCSLLAMRGVPLYDVMRLAGHSQISTTQCYAHLTAEHLRESVERLDVAVN